MRLAHLRRLVTTAHQIGKMSPAMSSMIEVAGVTRDFLSDVCVHATQRFCGVACHPQAKLAAHAAGQRTEIHELSAADSQLHIVIIPGKRPSDHSACC